MKKNLTKNLKAFSLIELSVLITILAILLAGTLASKASSEKNRKVRVTEEKMAKIYQAMGIYLARNEVLPCPAAINLKEDNANYGVAPATCNSAPASGSGYWQSSFYDFLYSGMIPTTTLGLPIEYSYDGFGGKFSYTVINGFTVAGQFGLNIASTSGGGGTYSTYIDGIVPSYVSSRINLYERMLNNDESTIDNIQSTNDVMFVIISHGANKEGAWNRNMTSQNPVSSSDEEKWNSVYANIDTTAGKADFFNSDSAFRHYIRASNVDSGFDDIVFGKTRDQMVYDFDLKNLLPCSGFTSEELTYGTSSKTYDWNSAEDTDIKYGEVIASEDTCPDSEGNDYSGGPTYPSKKCGAFGNWESGVINPCILAP